MRTEKTFQLPNFSDHAVLVCGDVMLDRYWHGHADRISPEAPVPVVNITKNESRPGGAANVAQNLASLGMSVKLCGFIGEDEAGRELQALLKSLSIDCHFQTLTHFPTITKLRVLGSHQQFIRLDFEKNLEETSHDHLLSQFEAQLEQVDVVILSDYSKGALNQVEKMIAMSYTQHKTILIDPKHKDYKRYAGATVLTPNRREFESVVGPCNTMDDLIKKARDLQSQIDIENLLITLGKEGMILIPKNSEPQHFHSKAKDVFDVTGAGDTVIAVLAAGLAAKMTLTDAIELANTAAGIVVGRLGAQAVTVEDLHHEFCHHDNATILTLPQLNLAVKQARARGEKIVMTNGCFDVLHVGHVDYLTKAKALGDRLLIAVNEDASVARLKGPDRPVNPLWARLKMLAALNMVDWVVSFKEDTPFQLINEVLPDVLVKGDDYQIENIVGAQTVLNSGGSVRTIPLVPHFSTTALLKKMQAVTT